MINDPTKCATLAGRATAYIRALRRELAAYEKFAAKVRDVSTSESLRTEADILLSKRETINTGVKS